jgi:uncharacterized membrane protein YhaH (DUF805 family)
VLVAWLGIIISVSPWIALKSTMLFFVFIILMSAVLISICYLKGEPPRWRWGRD